VRASRLGYEPLEVEVLVPAGGEVRLDLELRLRPVPIAGVTVRGRADAVHTDTAPLPAPALGLAGMRALEAATPGIAELGLGDGARGAPGQAPVDPTDVLYVRGAPADLKLVLLDGAPVYSPFHVGGLLDSFDAGVLGAAVLHLGGAPARYDGGLSYILDLATRAGRSDRLHSSGAVDLMSARATLEGPVGGGVRYLVATRGVHGAGLAPLLRADFPYGYREALARTDVALGAAGEVSFTGFINGEDVALDSLGSDAGWGNRSLSLRYRANRRGLDTDVAAAYGGFSTAIPALGERGFPARGETERVRLTADLAHAAGPLALRYGASFDRLALYQRVESRPGDFAARSWDGGAHGHSAGVYAEAAWRPLQRLRLRGGARADLFSTDPTPRLAPRLAATWMLSDRAVLTAAAGRYHQYVRTAASPANPVRAADVADTLFLPAGLVVGRATHLSLALHQQLDEGVRFGVEGYFKTFDGLPPPGDARSHVSGLDVWARRDVGRVQGWLGYSLTWVWAATGAAASTDRFAGREVLNAGLLADLGRGVALDLRAAYGAGIPYTAIPMDLAAHGPSYSAPPGLRIADPLSAVANGRNEAPLLPVTPADDYLRLDLGLARTFAAHWNGRPVEIAPYLRVLNPLHRRDALFYHHDRRHDAAPRPIGALPVLPVIGAQWRF
jgi:hypothetical protein